MAGHKGSSYQKRSERNEKGNCRHVLYRKTFDWFRRKCTQRVVDRMGIVRGSTIQIAKALQRKHFNFVIVKNDKPRG